MEDFSSICKIYECVGLTIINNDEMLFMHVKRIEALDKYSLRVLGMPRFSNLM